MKNNTRSKKNFRALAASGNSVSSIRKGEVLTVNSHSFNPIILPFFIRL